MLSSYSSYGVHPVELTLFIFFLMIRRPPRSTLFSLHDALPIFVLDDDVADDPSPVDGKCAHRLARKPDRKSTRLTSSHEWLSYAVFCLKKKTKSDRPKRTTVNNKQTVLKVRKEKNA